MKKALFLSAFLITYFLVFIPATFATQSPDTVSVGVYVTSIHDINFKEKEYSINLWLWLKYKRPEFDFMKNLEVINAKTFEKSYATIDTLEDGRIYMLMKLQCLMKGNWKINNFPFDSQKLRFTIENSQYDSEELIFITDTLGKHYGKFFLMGWEKDSFTMKSEINQYETAFGDAALEKPESAYSSYKVVMAVHRESWELFFKLFLGMYISFLISCVCFYIPTDNMDARLALSLGSLFAVIGNKYIVDSSLPESNSFTLVDSLHGLTLFYIFMVIASSVYTYKRHKEGMISQAKERNKLNGLVLLIAYMVLNAWFVFKAIYFEAAG
ncbi:MAG: hypothetical protein PSX81_14050 [bacterium]|nr:hypothetical protein [bacterium]